MTKPKADQVPRDPRIVVKHKTSKQSPELRVRDISRTGALIVANTELPVGSTIELKLPVQGAGFTLEGVGEVVRTQQNPVAMGVLFIMLTDESLSALNNFVRQ